MGDQGQAVRRMNDWATFGLLLLAALTVSVLVYLVITLWPQPIPRERSVDAIRQRIECEDGDR
ncbi:hypothetical protein CRH09_00090 [Nocardia terpenica]|uniref:Uncharacterized protein n=2 Tax=Nocardia terpenica TaxID=455432 RepID=A0A291RBX7_9NOCA|nr:hypothetical protein CRH09_00090 [Nocardia terpenica]